MGGQNLSSFIWSVANLLRGDYKQSEYGKVILPFTVLRRLDCALEVLRELTAEYDDGFNVNLFDNGALMEDSVVRKFRPTAADRESYNGVFTPRILTMIGVLQK